MAAILERIAGRQRYIRQLAAGAMAVLFAATLFLLPSHASGASDAAAPKLETRLGVANNSKKDTSYKASVQAGLGEMVQIQMYYLNAEADDSGRTANDVRAKFALPESEDTATVTGSVRTSNAAAVNDTVVVDIVDDNATLEYVPGTAVWKHNTGTKDAPKYTETAISDDVVIGGDGIVIEDLKPGEAYGSTISIRARVLGQGVKVTAQTQKQNQTGQWAASNTALPGEAMRMLIGYQNTSSSTQTGVAVRADLADKSTLTPGTTRVTTGAQAAGVAVPADNVTRNGIDIGTYRAGSNAFVSFDFRLPAAVDLKCGDNRVRNEGVVRLSTGGEYHATAVTRVQRDCPATAGTTPQVSENDARSVQQSAPPAPAPPPPVAKTPATPPPAARPTPPPATAPSAANLPATGPGDIVFIFVLTAIAGTFVYRFYLGWRPIGKKH